MLMQRESAPKNSVDITANSCCECVQLHEEECACLQNGSVPQKPGGRRPGARAGEGRQ